LVVREGVAIDRWTHVAVVRRTDHLSIWVDGKLAGDVHTKASGGGEPRDGPLHLRIGSRWPAGHSTTGVDKETSFPGQIEHMRWLTGACTPQQIGMLARWQHSDRPQPGDSLHHVSYADLLAILPPKQV
jgi:hypothetical protein